MGFWGKFLKKDNEQENIQEEFLPAEQAVSPEENEEMKEVPEAETPEEEIPAAVEETAPAAEETETEAQTEEAIAEETEAEKPEEEKSGFWGRLFKKEKAEEASAETPAEGTEAEKAVETAETEETVPEEEIPAVVEETAPAEETEVQTEEAVPVAEEPEEEAKSGFWGRLFKKEKAEEAPAETPAEGTEAEKAVETAETEETVPEEEIPAVVEETDPVAEETEVQTEEAAPVAEEPEKEAEEEEKGGFWGRLFKKEKAEEALTETPAEETEAEKAVETAETEETVPGEEIPAAEETEVQTEEAVVEEAEQEALPDEHSTGMFRRLKQGLAQTRMSISGKIEGLLSRSTEIDDDFYDELEDILMQADVGVETTMKLVENIRRTVHKKRIRETSGVFEVIKEEIRAILGEEKVDMEVVSSRPAVILVVGVNGAGKTTSIAKMAWRFKQGGSRVLLAAADTFRAAAIDQLQIWADRIGVSLVKKEEGSDPGAVVFDAVQEAKKGKYDILIVDTAGRLQNKANLMQEIAKLRKIINREIEGAPHEVLLVLDATTGQNALSQAKQFSEVTGVTGIILTKLDGTAKGGVVIAISSELNIPVKLIGIGEGMEDLREFSATAFADALFTMDTEKKEETDDENID